MRKIKFRAYDLKFHEYIYNIQRGGMVSAWTHNHTKTQKRLSFADFLNQQTRFIVEQSTELNDKNGNLIYEGDILKLDQISLLAHLDPTKNYDDHARFVYYPVTYENGSYSIDKLDPSEYCEIIDNIHNKK